MKQFAAFIKKEFLHILRDRRTMLLLIGMPIVLIILFGYAITTEIKQSPIAILDQSKDVETQRIIGHLGSSEYFTIYTSVSSPADLEALMKEGRVKMGVVFPSQFSQTLESTGSAPVQLITDATDPNEATMLSQYARNIISIALSDKVLQPLPMQIVPQTQLLYNPQMKGAYNFVPGVMGLILILICAMMTSVGIVREKEMGTMEVLLVSPLSPIYIIIAKAMPYLALSLLNIVTILLLSRFLLDVPIAGSVGLLMGLSVLYCVVSLALGLLISTIAENTKSAMLISGMALMLPVMLLSGMLFPIENMPIPLQLLSNLVPAKWFIIAVKDVMIKGLGVADIAREMWILAAMAVGLIAISVRRFKIRLE